MTSTAPARNATAPVATAVTIELDRPVDPATVTTSSFRVFGRWSGTARGFYTFANDGRSVILTPSRPFSAGETVSVNLSHDIAAADGTPLRDAGFAFQFSTAVRPSSRTFAQIDVFSDRTDPDVSTRIYGAMAPDLDGDGFLDLAVVNEDSADVRVFLNRADGSGRFGDLHTTVGIDSEASPNETADFDNDGNIDVCIAATNSRGNVWILLGNGNGTFRSVQEVRVGAHPRGIAVLDADGDGDMDIVNANIDANDLSLLLNDGRGSFSFAGFFEGGVDGEYGLAAADMNNDDITDLIVGARDSEHIAVLLGSGAGTFTPAGPPQSSGGHTWVVVTGDLNGDGNLDATVANSTSNNGAVLIGRGDGIFEPPVVTAADAHIVSTDLGDLDGDGDLDWVLSSFGGSFWRIYENDGHGVFTFEQEITSPANASCAVLYDADNDGDLDLGLTDEVADVVVLMENIDGSLCPPSPGTCRPQVAGWSSILRLRRWPQISYNGVSWRWTGGEPTSKADFGDPLTAEDYELCLYDGDELVYSSFLPAAQTCGGLDCWSETATGFTYRSGASRPGIQFLRLREQTSTPARVRFLRGGSAPDLPDLRMLTGPLRVQLHNRSAGPCWGATFPAPFLKQGGHTLTARSD